jgi:hypothetical protein
MLKNISYGQNLSSTAGEPEFFAQYFFEIPAPDVKNARAWSPEILTD